MERRLLPVNALIGLCTPHQGYPAPLATAGYRVSGLEVPVLTSDGTVVIDVAMFRAAENRAIAGEAKSGSNIEVSQARRYSLLEADDVVVATSATITSRAPRRIQPLYVCLEENCHRVVIGLEAAGLHFPVLSIGEHSIEHHGAEFDDPELVSAFDEPIPVHVSPPRIISVDDHSSDDDYYGVVLPVLTTHLSLRSSQVSVPMLAEEAVPHLSIFGKQARNRIIRKVGQAAHRAAQNDRATFDYVGATGGRDFAVVHFLRTPEELARQGRTQGYQAVARSAGKTTRRRKGPGPDQLALFDTLIHELEQGDGDLDDLETGGEESE